MKILSLTDADASTADIVTALTAGGLVCLPVRGSYRLIADMRSEPAIMRMMQSKRRATNHPALVFVADLAAASTIVDGTAWTTTRRFATAIWPRSLTLMLPPSDTLAPAIKRTLTRATGRLGVRLPDDELAARVLRAFGAPLLVSSANFERKPGANSAAAVRQRFAGTVDVWVNAGDTTPSVPSTVVEPAEHGWTLKREGAVTRAELDAVMAAA